MVKLKTSVIQQGVVNVRLNYRACSMMAYNNNNNVIIDKLLIFSVSQNNLINARGDYFG